MHHRLLRCALCASFIVNADGLDRDSLFVSYDF